MAIFDLADQVALVTGASRGIGRAIAECLAEQGARVVVASRSLESCQAVADDICRRFGPGRAMAAAANISSRDDLIRLVDLTTAALGPIDILVCNAATNVHYGPAATLSDEAFRKILNNNIVSTHWLIQLVAPQMVARRRGAITIISSIGACSGSAMIGAYDIAKAGLNQMARNLAVELGRHEIRVNCVAPGLVRTEFSRALWEDEKLVAGALAATPLRRLGEPRDIAGAVAFLSSAAGSFVTGQVLTVDGGVTISAAAIGEPVSPDAGQRAV